MDNTGTRTEPDPIKEPNDQTEDTGHKSTMDNQASETGDTQVEEDESKSHVIDDLSKQLVDNLMTPQGKPEEQVKYVSIQDKIKLKQQEELSASSKSSEGSPVAGVHGLLTPIVASSTSGTVAESANGSIDTCLDMDPSVDGNSVEISHSNGLPAPPQTEKKASNLPSSLSTDIDSSLIMSIPKSSTSINQPKMNGGTGNNLWSDSSDITVMLQSGINNSQSAELDVLTAISGADVASSLPNVLDGLSEGEISSDSDCEVETIPNGDHTSLTQGRPASLIGRSPLEDDPFYKTHQMIMRSRKPEQIEQMNSVLSDIQNIVGPTGQAGSGMNGKSLDPVSSPVWRIRDTYSDLLREQEDKRKKRMEREKRYEAEYRQQHLDEIYQMEQDDHKMGAVHALEDDDSPREPVNADYIAESSDEDDDITPQQGGSGAWGWPGGSKQYSRVSNIDSAGSSPAHGVLAGRASGPSNISNASRLADHENSTSPTQTSQHKDVNREKYWKNPFNKKPSGSGPSGDTRLSTSSLNSYSSSSQASSSQAASTVIRRTTNRDSECSSSSSDSWDSASDQPPITLSKSQEGAKPTGSRSDRRPNEKEYDTDEETDKLLTKPYVRDAPVEIPENDPELAEQAMKNKAKEVTVYDPDEPTVLIDGILFRAAYLGSTQLVSESHPSKAMRMMQAQEAVGRIKASDGESQPSTDVDLFVSTEKVMVLNTDLKEIMMDHTLRSISYIADIDQILVVMAKRSMVQSEEETTKSKEQKLICHIFETDEAHLIAQSIGQAFQVAYMQFLKANGIDEPTLPKDTSYEDILEQQEIMHDELEMFTRKDMQKEVVVPKSRGEILGVVIVESGWGSVLPTVTLANMSPTGPAARCGQLNIGDQIMSVNGISLVGLPLSTCQEHIRAIKNVTAVRLCVVSRTPVIEVLIRRPDKKYQLGFSVQNGVICSLLRGGIAERGGVRVGHRIIEINGKSVVAVTHDSIVQMLSTSIGEIHMKTMPMAVFKLLTGQEIPQYI